MGYGIAGLPKGEILRVNTKRPWNRYHDRGAHVMKPFLPRGRTRSHGMGFSWLVSVRKGSLVNRFGYRSRQRGVFTVIFCGTEVMMHSGSELTGNNQDRVLQTAFAFTLGWLLFSRVKCSISSRNFVSHRKAEINLTYCNSTVIGRCLIWEYRCFLCYTQSSSVALRFDSIAVFGLFPTVRFRL